MTGGSLIVASSSGESACPVDLVKRVVSGRRDCDPDRIGAEAAEARQGDAFDRYKLPFGSSRSREWIGALAEDGEIAPIAEDATSFSAGDLLKDAKAFQIGERRIYGRSR